MMDIFKRNYFFAAFFVLFLLIMNVCMVNAEYNAIHYKVDDARPLQADISGSGDLQVFDDTMCSFTFTFYNLNGDHVNSTKVIVPNDYPEMEYNGFFNTPIPVGYMLVSFNTGIYDKKNHKYIEKVCPGGNRIFFFDPDCPINSTFVFYKARDSNLYEGLEHFSFKCDKVTIRKWGK